MTAGGLSVIIDTVKKSLNGLNSATVHFFVLFIKSLVKLIFVVC